VLTLEFMSVLYPYHIITGPPSSGKSTVINELSNRGYNSHKEVARIIIKENQINGVNHFPWKNMAMFSEQVFNRITENLKSLNGEFCFFDRSIIDLIAYLELNDIYDNEKYKNEILTSGYQKNVFYLPFWEKIYLHDLERKESKEEAINIGKQLKKVYSELGFNLIEVPYGNLNERVDFILNAIL